MAQETPRPNDISLAKTAIRWDDEVSNELVKCFSSTNDYNIFNGTKSELNKIRNAMKRYEEQEADAFEDKKYYDARRRLQFMETNDEE